MVDVLHVSGKWIVKVGSYELFSVGKIREVKWKKNKGKIYWSKEMSNVNCHFIYKNIISTIKIGKKILIAFYCKSWKSRKFLR